MAAIRVAVFVRQMGDTLGRNDKLERLRENVALRQTARRTTRGGYDKLVLRVDESHST